MLANVYSNNNRGRLTLDMAAVLVVLCYGEDDEVIFLRRWLSEVLKKSDFASSHNNFRRKLRLCGLVWGLTA